MIEIFIIQTPISINMTKEEYLKAKVDRVNKMTHDQLKRAFHGVDEAALKYFVAWNKCEERIKELEMYLFSLKRLDLGFKVPSDQQIHDKSVFYAKQGAGSKYDFEMGAKWMKQQIEGDEL